ncbi:MAG: hypothetical protein R3316_12465 [Rhodovibrionaceae bacterium]|nr:hypothetical protein [Rhodovibrionaceae bacterium]
MTTRHDSIGTLARATVVALIMAGDLAVIGMVTARAAGLLAW